MNNSEKGQEQVYTDPKLLKMMQNDIEKIMAKRRQYQIWYTTHDLKWVIFEIIAVRIKKDSGENLFGYEGL